MTGIRTAWLDSRIEMPQEPEIAMVDPHHHLWDYPESRYLAEEFEGDARGHAPVKSVFVECGSMYRTTGPEALHPVGETEFVEAIAREARRQGAPCAINAGIVGHANLLLGDAVAEVLEAHLEASPERFRGIRHSAAWHPSPAIRESIKFVHPATETQLTQMFRQHKLKVLQLFTVELITSLLLALPLPAPQVLLV